MGRSNLSGCCMAPFHLLSPDSLCSILDVICGIVDVGVNIFFFVVLCLWMPSSAQGVLLLGVFGSVLLVLGDFQPKAALRSSRVELERGAKWLWSFLRVGAVLRPRPQDPSVRRRRNHHKAKARFHWTYRRKLPFRAAMVEHRKARDEGYHIATSCPSRLRRWRRRRNHRARLRMKRRRTENHEFFLTPNPKSHFLNRDAISTEVLDNFCDSKGEFFLKFPQLLKKLDVQEHGDKAQRTVDRANILASGIGEALSSTTFWNCPLVWDTGASFGLTPFRGDFIDYVECKIEVKDISKTNIVIGIGTTLHKFNVNGEPIWLPCLSYHLPSAEVRLFSPQTYHTLYGGHSVVKGDCVEMFVGEHQLVVPIDREGANVPTVSNSAVSRKEIANIGPHIRSALPHTERKIDFFGSWSSRNFDAWNVKTVCDEFDHYAGFCGPCVASADNVNLTAAQKELLLWHWKLGVSMRRVQELMRPQRYEEPSGARGVLDPVIIPRIPTASSCPIPVCESSELARAKQRNPKVVKSRAIAERQGCISADKYLPGDFVSIDQYVVRTPGRLPNGYGRERDCNKFHGGTIFRDAASKVIRAENQVSLGAGETVTAKLRFEEWLWEQAAVRVKHYHSDDGIFNAEMFEDACKDSGQTQSFSGVGAKHQNAEAERAIQTIMSMARMFMIHSGLHWIGDGSDDLSLWSFAVDHACWIYNRLP